MVLGRGLMTSSMDRRSIDRLSMVSVDPKYVKKFQSINKSMDQIYGPLTDPRPVDGVLWILFFKSSNSTRHIILKATSFKILLTLNFL